MSGKKCIKVPVVLGVGSTQQLICTEIPLCPPAFEIKDVIKRVEVISCEVGGVVEDIKGHKVAKVIIDAVLKKNINFKTLKDRCKPKRGRDHDHHDDDGDDVLAPGETRVRCGDLRHCFVEIPFCTLVEVEIDKHAWHPHEKLICQLEEADVVAQATEIFRCDDDDETFDRIVEKDVVRLVVKVDQLQQIEVPASDCPPPKC